MKLAEKLRGMHNELFDKVDSREVILEKYNKFFLEANEKNRQFIEIKSRLPDADFKILEEEGFSIVEYRCFGITTTVSWGSSQQRIVREEERKVITQKVVESKNDDYVEHPYENPQHSCPKCGSRNFVVTWYTDNCNDCNYGQLY